MNCEYVREYYGVPACIGRRVVCYGKPGVIVEDQGHYIGVALDEDKPTVVKTYHPTDKVEYGELGTVRKMTRSKKRYQDYLKVADCFESFKDYLYYLSELRRI
jgi:hypothetical protein